MTDYISREAVCYQFEKQETIDGQPRAIRRARRIVEDFPAADVREVKRGKWVMEDDGMLFYRCSACGKAMHGWFAEIYMGDGHFCPNCGASMSDADS